LEYFNWGSDRKDTEADFGGYGSGAIEGSKLPGSGFWTRFLQLINYKENQIIQLENQKVYSDSKMGRLEKRIQALEEEIGQLR
jgi:hypothetical protein